MLMCNLGVSLSTARSKVRAINNALGLPCVIRSLGTGVTRDLAVETSAVRLLFLTADSSYYIRWTVDVASVAGVTRTYVLRDGSTETATAPLTSTGDIPSATVLGMLDQGADYLQPLAGTPTLELFGDSWTQGTGDPDWVGYRQLLATGLSERGLVTLQKGITRCGTFEQSHSGFGGLQVAQMQFTLENRWWLLRQPDGETQVCVIFAGLNDVLTSGSDAAAIAKAPNVGSFITSLRNLYPSTWIVHVQLPTYTGSPGSPTNTNKIIAYNAAVQTVLDGHQAHIDGVLIRANLANVLSLPSDLSDAVPHPSVAGYEKIANALVPAVLAAFGTIRRT